jgi:hypothetical protein
MANTPVNTQNALPGLGGSGSATAPTDSIIVNGLATPVLWAEINTNADATIVGADATRRIRVISIDFIVAAATDVGWSSAGNVLRNPQSFAANSGLVRDLVYPYFCQTNPAEDLVINVTGGRTRGMVGYVLV